MIIYSADKTKFLDDQLNGRLITEIDEEIRKHYRRVSPAEMISWRNSLAQMAILMGDDEIPNNVGVAIEYMIPATSNRIDFLVSGLNEQEEDSAVIIELKQWQDASKVEGLDNIVETYLGGGLRRVTHPSYQAWSYMQLLKDFNSSVDTYDINLHPCCYLHNYDVIDQDPLLSDQYQEILNESPLFGMHDATKLRGFIKKYIKKGDQAEVLKRIEYGKIKPSKSLQDSLTSMLTGNKEFTMIDEQKVVFEEVLHYAKLAQKTDDKYVYIVEGGPGTGKSVVAINLLVELTAQNLYCQYVTKNMAPRSVYQEKLSGTIRKSRIANLFKGSSSYVETADNAIDALIVDEAHRLNERSQYSKAGSHQIRDIINSSKFSVFFIDEDQRVTTSDIGTIETIEHFAQKAGATIVKNELSSQFRCNGSDGYLAWTDDVLEIRKTAHPILDIDFDFEVLDSPNEVYKWVVRKNQESNKARMLAGYCWEWPKVNRSNPNKPDIVIEDYNFAMSWNADNIVWAIDENSVNQIGCIHTSQGLEFDYVGLIVGPDLRYENGHVITDPDKRAKTDKSLVGLKKKAEKDPEAARKEADTLIRNTYRTLLTRGMKACRVFCCDKDLGEYLKSRIANSSD